MGLETPGEYGGAEASFTAAILAVEGMYPFIFPFFFILKEKDPFFFLLSQNSPRLIPLSVPCVIST